MPTMEDVEQDQENASIPQQMDLINSDDDDFEPMKPRKIDSPQKSEEVDEDDPRWVENDVEDLECMICSTPYHNAGPHKIVSLKCGHLFGLKCIQKWIDVKKRKKDVPKCPNCNQPCKKGDIRPIYTRRVGSLDTAEVAKLKKELETEQKARLEVENKLARLELLHQSAIIAKNKVEAEKSELLKRVLDLSGKVEMYKWKLGEPNLPEEPPLPTKYQTIMKPLRSISLGQVNPINTRAFVMDAVNHWLLIGVEQLGNHGILKVTMDNSVREFIPLHQKCIRDINPCPDNPGMILTASMDKTMKLTNVCTTNATVAKFELPQPCWSCAWNHLDQNLVFAGLQNNTVLVFDIRSPHEAIQSISIGEIGRGPPIRCLLWALNGLLISDGNNLCLWKDLKVNRIDLGAQGSCLSLNLCNQTLLATFRTLESPPVHMTLDVETLMEEEKKIVRFFGQHPGTLLSKSCLINFKDETYVFGSDEQTYEVR